MLEDRIWAGTEESLKRAMSDDEQKSTRMRAGEFSRAEPDDGPSRLSSVDGPLARLSIAGTLTNDDDAGWNEMIGHTGYPEIRQAMVEAANDPAVKHIVLDIDSPGGSVNGLEDTAKLISMINTRVKPVTAFTGGHMMSAAYWLGSSAGEVYSTKSAEVGSIGVIATHAEQSEALEKEGIKVTVMRAGKYKSLATPYEKLTDDAKTYIQSKLDFTYRTFVEGVAESRGKSYEYADSVMAQGREFYGQAALDAGLIDGITSFDALVSAINQKYVDDAINSTYDRGNRAHAQAANTQEGIQMRVKKVLTEADIAAIAAGVTLSAGAPDAGEKPGDDAAAPDDKDGAGTDEGETGDDTGDAPDKPAGGDGDPDDPKSGKAAASAAASNVDISAATVTLLSTQLKGVNEELMAARIALSKTEDKLTVSEAALGPLKDIAAKAVNNMRVALQTSVLDMSAMSPQQVLSEHAAVASNFAAAYKAGGVSSVSAGASAPGGERMSAMARARLRAVSNSK